MRYLKKEKSGCSSYHFVEECSLFGCNNGFIPWLLSRQVSSSQSEPYKWHLPIQDSLKRAKWGETDCDGSTLIIDLKPKQNKKNLSSTSCWMCGDTRTQAGVPYSCILVDYLLMKIPKRVNRNQFDINDNKREEPIFEFMYLDGSVEGGKLVGRWNAPPASPTNAALLWPEPLAYFFTSIRNVSGNLI